MHWVSQSLLMDQDAQMKCVNEISYNSKACLKYQMDNFHLYPSIPPAHNLW